MNQNNNFTDRPYDQNAGMYIFLQEQAKNKVEDLNKDQIIAEKGDSMIQEFNNDLLNVNNKEPNPPPTGTKNQMPILRVLDITR